MDFNHFEIGVHIILDKNWLTGTEVGLFPEWVPGTPTALLHNGQFMSKHIDTYVRTAATAPRA